MQRPALLDVLRTGWRWVIGCLVLGVLAGTGYVAVTPPTYRATTRLVVTPTAQVPDAAAAYQSSLLAQRLAASYSTLLQGQDFAGLVVSRLQLTTSPEDLQSALIVAPVPESNLITASVEAHDALSAQRIANALGSLFAVHLETLDVEQTAPRTGARVTVAESASRPTSAVGPRPVRDLGLTGALGLLVGMALAFSRHRRRTLFQRATELETSTGTRLLAVLSRDQWRRREEIRELRMSLLPGREQDEYGTLVVAGMRRELPTSELVVALGQSFVDLGASVVVIRAATGTPSSPSRTGEIGLSEVALGLVGLLEAVEGGAGLRPDVLHSGRAVSGANDLLASPAMRNLLEEAQSAYDVVLLECPPTDESAGAASLASHGARVLLLVSARDLGQERLVAVLRRLEQARARVAGVVVVAHPGRTRARRSGGAQHEARAGARFPTPETP